MKWKEQNKHFLMLCWVGTWLNSKTRYTVIKAVVQVCLDIAVPTSTQYFFNYVKNNALLPLNTADHFTRYKSMPRVALPGLYITTTLLFLSPDRDLYHTERRRLNDSFEILYHSPWWLWGICHLVFRCFRHWSPAGFVLHRHIVSQDRSHSDT